MKTNTTTEWYVHSKLGLVTAIVAGAMASAIIVQDAFPNGISDWGHVKLDHWLTPLFIGIAAVLWLQAERCIKESEYLGGTLLTIAAAACSLVIVYESMGRGAEHLDAKVNEANKDVGAYAALITNLDKANKLVAEAETWVAGECRTGKKTKCEGTTFVFEQRKAYAEKLKKEAEAHKVPPPVDARGERVAFIASLAGYDGKAWKEGAHYLSPLFRPINLELVILLMLRISIRTRTVTVPVFNAVSNTVPAEEPKALSFEREDGEYTDEEIDELTKILNAADRPLTNNEVAAALRCHKSWASKLVQAGVESGKVTKLKVGRFNAISLVA